MNKEGVKYLEYLTRFGLNPKVLQDYRRCGMLHISENKLLSYTKPFTDVYIEDERWIELVKEVENISNKAVYHIVNTMTKDKYFGTELLVMCIPYEDKFNEFKQGIADGYVIYPEEGLWFNAKIKYKVKLEHLTAEVINEN